MVVHKLALLPVVRHDNQYVKPAANETGMSVNSARRLAATFVKFAMRGISDTRCERRRLTEAKLRPH